MNRKKNTVAVVTTTRADYGILYWTLKTLQNRDDIALKILAGGMHLDKKFGETIEEIQSDGFSIEAEFDFLKKGHGRDSVLSMVESMATATTLFAQYLNNNNVDMLLLIGDRFEMFAAAQAALLMQVSVAHIHGGEITEGAVDDAIRHCISKIACLHFTSTEQHRRRVIQMGARPLSVVNVGAPSLESIIREPLMDRVEIEKSIDLDFSQPLLLITYHSETLSSLSPDNQVKPLIEALKLFPEFQLLITGSNADAGGLIISQYLQDYLNRRRGRHVWCQSLGRKRYLSILQYVSVVVGNSSSGLIEVPSFCKPTVNIGNRQKGRESAASVIHCEMVTESIVKAIQKALSYEFQGGLKTIKNPYGKGDSSKEIVSALSGWLGSSRAVEKFYDITDK